MEGRVIRVVRYNNKLIYPIEDVFSKPQTMQEIRDGIPEEERDFVNIIVYSYQDIVPVSKIED